MNALGLAATTALLFACSSPGSSADAGVGIDALDPNVLTLTVRDPADGLTTNLDHVVVTGTVTGVTPSVTVNGVAAVIDAAMHTWQASVPLATQMCNAIPTLLTVTATDTIGSAPITITRSVTYDNCPPHATVVPMSIYDEQGYRATFDRTSFAPCLYRLASTSTTTLDYDVNTGSTGTSQVYKYAINTGASPPPGCSSTNFVDPDQATTGTKDTNGNRIHWRIHVTDDLEGPYFLKYQFTTADPAVVEPVTPLDAAPLPYVAGSKAQDFDIYVTTANAAGLDSKAGRWTLTLLVTDRAGNGPMPALRPIQWDMHQLGGPLYVEDLVNTNLSTYLNSSSYGLTGTLLMAPLDVAQGQPGIFVRLFRLHNGTPYDVDAKVTVAGTVSLTGTAVAQATQKAGGVCVLPGDPIPDVCGGKNTYSLPPQSYPDWLSVPAFATPTTVPKNGSGDAYVVSKQYGFFPSSDFVFTDGTFGTWYLYGTQGICGIDLGLTCTSGGQTGERYGGSVTLNYLNSISAMTTATSISVTERLTGLSQPALFPGLPASTPFTVATWSSTEDANPL